MEEKTCFFGQKNEQKTAKNNIFLTFWKKVTEEIPIGTGFYKNFTLFLGF